MWYYLLIFLGILVVLLIFIGWDRRRLQSGMVEPMPREALAHGWRARPLLLWPIHAALALCAAALAAGEFQSPRQPPFTGRLSSVYAVMHSRFGEFGAAYFWLAVALLFAVLALAAWRSGATAKPSTPR